MEEWKDIDGYEGIYKISSLGNIKSMPRTNKYINHKIGGVILKKPLANGYPVSVLCKDKTRNRQYVHRLVAKAFIPNPENKPFINHINSIRNDNNISNLEWCTQKENVHHARRMGRMNQGLDLSKYTNLKGADHFRSKLTQEDVDGMRERYNSGKYSYKELSEKYNIGMSQVGKIVRMRSWLN